MDDNQNGVSSSNFRNVSVHAGPGVSEGLSKGDEDTCKFLSTFVEGLFFLVVLVDLDELGSVKELHDHGSSDDGRDTQLHESASVGSQDGSHPVERIGLFTFDDTVEGDLAAEQVNKHHNAGPDLLGLEGHSSHRGFDFRNQTDCWLQDSKKLRTLL